MKGKARKWTLGVGLLVIALSLGLLLFGAAGKKLSPVNSKSQGANKPQVKAPVKNTSNRRMGKTYTPAPSKAAVKKSESAPFVPNDECTTAQNLDGLYLTAGVPIRILPQAFDNDTIGGIDYRPQIITNATDNAATDQLACDFANHFESVWFYYRAPADGVLYLSTYDPYYSQDGQFTATSPLAGRSDFDSLITVLTTENGDDCGTFIPFTTIPAGPPSVGDWAWGPHSTFENAANDDFYPAGFWNNIGINNFLSATGAEVHNGKLYKVMVQVFSDRPNFPADESLILDSTFIPRLANADPTDFTYQTNVGDFGINSHDVALSFASNGPVFDVYSLSYVATDRIESMYFHYDANDDGDTGNKFGANRTAEHYSVLKQLWDPTVLSVLPWFGLYPMGDAIRTAFSQVHGYTQETGTQRRNRYYVGAWDQVTDGAHTLVFDDAGNDYDFDDIAATCAGNETMDHSPTMGWDCDADGWNDYDIEYWTGGAIVGIAPIKLETNKTNLIFGGVSTVANANDCGSTKSWEGVTTFQRSILFGTGLELTAGDSVVDGVDDFNWWGGFALSANMLAGTVVLHDTGLDWGVNEDPATYLDSCDFAVLGIGGQPTTGNVRNLFLRFTSALAYVLDDGTFHVMTDDDGDGFPETDYDLTSLLPVALQAVLPQTVAMTYNATSDQIFIATHGNGSTLTNPAANASQVWSVSGLNTLVANPNQSPVRDLIYDNITLYALNHSDVGGMGADCNTPDGNHDFVFNFDNTTDFPIPPETYPGASNEYALGLTTYVPTYNAGLAVGPSEEGTIYTQNLFGITGRDDYNPDLLTWPDSVQHGGADASEFMTMIGDFQDRNGDYLADWDCSLTTPSGFNTWFQDLPYDVCYSYFKGITGVSYFHDNWRPDVWLDDVIDTACNGVGCIYTDPCGTSIPSYPQNYTFPLTWHSTDFAGTGVKGYDIYYIYIPDTLDTANPLRLTTEADWTFFAITTEQAGFDLAHAGAPCDLQSRNWTIPCTLENGIGFFRIIAYDGEGIMGFDESQWFHVGTASSVTAVTTPTVGQLVNLMPGQRIPINNAHRAVDVTYTYYVDECVPASVPNPTIALEITLDNGLSWWPLHYLDPADNYAEKVAKDIVPTVTCGIGTDVFNWVVPDYYATEAGDFTWEIRGLVVYTCDLDIYAHTLYAVGLAGPSFRIDDDLGPTVGFNGSPTSDHTTATVKWHQIVVWDENEQNTVGPAGLCSWYDPELCWHTNDIGRFDNLNTKEFVVQVLDASNNIKKEVNITNGAATQACVDMIGLATGTYKAKVIGKDNYGNESVFSPDCGSEDWFPDHFCSDSPISFTYTAEISATITSIKIVRKSNGRKTIKVYGTGYETGDILVLNGIEVPTLFYSSGELRAPRIGKYLKKGTNTLIVRRKEPKCDGQMVAVDSAVFTFTR